MKADEHSEIVKILDKLIASGNIANYVFYRKDQVILIFSNCDTLMITGVSAGSSGENALQVSLGDYREE